VIVRPSARRDAAALGAASADGLVLTGGWVLESSRVCRAADVRIEGGRIAAIGQGVARDGDRRLNVAGRLIAPGFVQTHVHLCQTLFRGAADGLDLVDWLAARILPLERALDEEATEAAALLGAVELIRGGTTAIADFGPSRFPDAIFTALDRIGLRAQAGPSLADGGTAGSAAATGPDRALAEVDRLASRWAGHERLRVAVMPRGIRSASDTLLRESAALAVRRELPLQTHAAESAREVAAVVAERGRRPIELLADLEVIGPRAQLAHCVWTEPWEREMLARSGSSVVHCPSSNLKLGSGIAPVPDYLRRGIPVSLGADGAACNNALDALAEMRLAALIHTVTDGPSAVGAQVAYDMATTAGATALRWPHLRGELVTDALADLVVIEIDAAHLAPLPAEPDAAWAVGRLVYSARAGDIESVFVNGRPLMWERRIGTVDEEEVRRRASSLAKRTFERAAVSMSAGARD
jgi:5-methylthioadenosine/S-adenosylhomocysteine deaminase